MNGNISEKIHKRFQVQERARSTERRRPSITVKTGIKELLRKAHVYARTHQHLVGIIRRFQQSVRETVRGLLSHKIMLPIPPQQLSYDDWNYLQNEYLQKLQPQNTLAIKKFFDVCPSLFIYFCRRIEFPISWIFSPQFLSVDVAAELCRKIRAHQSKDQSWWVSTLCPVTNQEIVKCIEMLQI
jgi:hypothetical protein